MIYPILLQIITLVNFTITSSLGLATPSPNTITPQQRQQGKSVSIVTGSRGYLGRQIIHQILDDCSNSNNNNNNNDSTENEILCLVREKNVQDEQSYWDKVTAGMTSLGGGGDDDDDDDDSIISIKVMPYDMLDGGMTVTKALEHAFKCEDGDDDDDTDNAIKCCVYHVASIFTPTEDHYTMALQNVKGTEDLMNAIVKHASSSSSSLLKNIRVVITSSTAAVRGPNQEPLNGKFYTYKDWNTASEHGKNWGHSYQWSKAESERKAWDIANEHGLSMTSMCPSFIFGPPNGETSSSYSIEIVDSWITGRASVQSRLCVDIRDVAKAHCLAGTLEKAVGERIIISSEARISSQKTADEFQRIARETGFDADKIHPDTNFDGGAIAIGKSKVETSIE